MSSFSFNLNNEDIEDDPNDGDEAVSTPDVRESPKTPAAEPELHTLEDMVRKLAYPHPKIHTVVSYLQYQTPVAKQSAPFVMFSPSQSL